MEAHSPEESKRLPGLIKAYREKAGMRQEDLAAALGVDPMTVSRWERGTRRPRPSEVEKIAKALKVKPSVLSEARAADAAGARETANVYSVEEVVVPFVPVAEAQGLRERPQEDPDGAMAWLRVPLRWLRSLGDPAHLAAVLVEGDAMMPTLRPGEVAIVDHAACRDGKIPGSGIYLFRLAGHPQMARLNVCPDGSVDVLPENGVYSRRNIPAGDPALDVLARVKGWTTR